MEQIIAFFNSLGWLANVGALMALAGTIVGLIVGVPKWWRWWSERREIGAARKAKDISSYVKMEFPRREAIVNTIKEKSQIAILEDKPTDFPVDYLRRAGFKVEVYEKISFTEIGKLLPYTVLLLDIKGVVIEDMERGGLELIKRLKRNPQSPIVIAVSGLSFDPTATEFFRLADGGQMKKPIREQDCEERLLAVLEEKMSPIEAGGKIDKFLRGFNLNAKEFSWVVRELVLALHSRGDMEKLRRKIEGKSGHSLQPILPDIETIIGWGK